MAIVNTRVAHRFMRTGRRMLRAVLPLDGSETMNGHVRLAEVSKNVGWNWMPGLNRFDATIFCGENELGLSLPPTISPNHERLGMTAGGMKIVQQRITEKTWEVQKGHWTALTDGGETELHSHA